jgi:hypothetical protein
MKEPRKTVTLEDLLRVKRAEQPPAEFWDQFERGMRTKQLAAIVEPRPWWAPFIRVGARFSRYQVPVGAAAILAVTFITLREYRTAEIRPVYEPAVTVSVPASIPEAVAKNNAVVLAAAPTEVVAVSARVPSAPAPMQVDAEESDAADNSPVGIASHLVPAPSELTPSARYIAENLAAARAADPDLDQMLNRATRNVEPRQSRAEPLAQVNFPGQSRRERLLAGNAWLASASSNNDSARRTDYQPKRRLTEHQVSESDVVSRVDLGGSTVSLKF